MFKISSHYYSSYTFDHLNASCNEFFRLTFYAVITIVGVWLRNVAFVLVVETGYCWQIITPLISHLL